MDNSIEDRWNHLQGETPDFRYAEEIQDLVFFYKALYGYVDLDIRKFVTFLNHDISRQTLNPNLLLKVPFCRTTTFKNSYFNRTVHLWNTVCRTALCQYLVLRTFFGKLTPL